MEMKCADFQEKTANCCFCVALNNSSPIFHRSVVLIVGSLYEKNLPVLRQKNNIVCDEHRFVSAECKSAECEIPRISFYTNELSPRFTLHLKKIACWNIHFSMRLT